MKGASGFFCEPMANCLHGATVVPWAAGKYVPLNSTAVHTFPTCHRQQFQQNFFFNLSIAIQLSLKENAKFTSFSNFFPSVFSGTMPLHSEVYLDGCENYDEPDFSAVNHFLLLTKFLCAEGSFLSWAKIYYL